VPAGDRVEVDGRFVLLKIEDNYSSSGTGCGSSPTRATTRPSDGY
jgi:hypothetical protein